MHEMTDPVANKQTYIRTHIGPGLRFRSRQPKAKYMHVGMRTGEQIPVDHQPQHHQIRNLPDIAADCVSEAGAVDKLVWRHTSIAASKSLPSSWC